MIDKLATQVESFREGFEVLSKAHSFPEMTKIFSELLKSNLSLTQTDFFQKISENPGWQSLSGVSASDNLTSMIEEGATPKIKYFKDGNYLASVCLPLSDRTRFGILLGKRPDKSDFSDFDKILLQMLLQLFDSSHKYFLNQKKEKELIFDLNEKVLQLNNLIDTGIELSRYEMRSVLFDLALERISSLTNASSSLFRVRNISDSAVESEAIFPPGMDAQSITGCKYKISCTFDFREKEYEIVLSEKETRQGTTKFNELDELLLSAVCRQVQVVIENEYLQQQALEMHKLEQELIVAASIQQRLIPKELPEIKGYDLAGINIPSREVGGDYYDIINLNNGKYALVIADVAGKGIAAALLVNTLNAALYSYLEFHLPLTEMSDKLNKLIYNSSPSDKFITFFIAVLDPESGETDIVNAGHNPIFLLRSNGTLEQIEAGSVGLGMFDLGIPYVGSQITIQPGDKLFLYTDGIPEAMNENDEEYSDEKMISFLKDHSNERAEEFVTALVSDVKSYTGSTPQSDDITMIMLKRNL